MNSEDLDKKRVMHIDTSCKLYERKNTGIAYKIINSNLHKGLALSLKLKRELERDLEIHYDYARIYAICIYYLIKEDLNLFDILVICGDENINYVKRYLDLLFTENDLYINKSIISIADLREITGKKKLKSGADNVARSYRKRGLKKLWRRQKGLNLNLVDLNYSKIKEKWIEIDKI